MCGIAGIYLKDLDNSYFTTKELEQTVDWLLWGIEHRGKDATGIAVQDVEGNPFLEKSDMEAGKFIFWRRDLPENPRIILLHTRLSTKGKPENLLNNHPIEYKNIMAIHNGHISNDDELFKEEELDRIAEVDSEIIPALLHKYTFAEPKLALEKMSGGFAISAFDRENPGALLLAKGTSSPLHYVETSGMWIWASEADVIAKALEYGFGYETKKDEVKELAYARYIVINGHESETHDFKPFFKTYTSTPSSGYVGKISDGWSKTSGMYGRDQCDECFVWYQMAKLEKIGNDWLCEHCIAKIVDEEKQKPKSEKRLSRKERKRLRKQKAREFQQGKSGETKTIVIPKKRPEGIAEALDEEHWVICQLVAEFYGTKPDFVDFMLFNQDDLTLEDFEDPNLVSMYLELEAKYKEYLEEVRGETDAIIEDISCNPRFPVGF